MTFLWARGQIKAKAMKLFAYHDNEGTTHPLACADADESHQLSPSTIFEKRRLLIEFYGFCDASWEVKAMPEIESFYYSDNPSLSFPSGKGKSNPGSPP